MAARTAILHIGTGKTGTTSIQRALGQNREALRDLGFAYPLSPGEASHTKLAVFMQDCAGAAPGRKHVRAGPTSQFLRALRAEIEGLPSSVKTVIFSSEHIFNNGFEPGVVPQLRDLLAPMFGEFRVIVYLRRQDEVAVSRLSTRLKAGRAYSAVFPAAEHTRTGFDYDLGLKPWIETFGEAAITPRIFCRNELLDGDVVRDFMAVCGLPDLPPVAAEANTSLLPHAQEFLRLINLPSEPESGADPTAQAARKPPRNWRPPKYLRTFLTKQYGGRGALPSRADAVAFFESFADSNERVRAKFFPHRNRLFDNDFERYPETAMAPSDAEVLSVALAVTRLQSEMIAEMRAANAVERARKALAAGERDAMLTAFLNALDFQPTHESALHELVAAVETPEEVLSVRQFLAGASISATRKAAVEADLQARFGGQAMASKRDLSAQARVAARKASRQAQRQGQPTIPPASAIPMLSLQA